MQWVFSSFTTVQFVNFPLTSQSSLSSSLYLWSPTPSLSPFSLSLLLFTVANNFSSLFFSWLTQRRASGPSQVTLQAAALGGHSGTGQPYLLWQLRLLPQPPIWSVHPIQLVPISTTPCPTAPPSPTWFPPNLFTPFLLRRFKKAVRSSKLAQPGKVASEQLWVKLQPPDPGRPFTPSTTTLQLSPLSHIHTQRLIHTFILRCTSRAHIQSDTSHRNCLCLIRFLGSNSHRFLFIISICSLHLDRNKTMKNTSTYDKYFPCQKEVTE